MQQGFVRFILSIGFCSFLFVAPQAAAAYEVPLDIEDVHYSFEDDTTLVVNWNTTIPAGTTAYLSKQSPPPPAEYSKISPRPKSLEHSVVFDNLVPHGTFRLSFSASTDGLGQTASYEYPASISVDGEVASEVASSDATQSSYPFTLPGGAPTELKGPFIFNCWGNFTVLWVFPKSADYRITVTDAAGRDVVQTSGAHQNPAVLQFIPPGRQIDYQQFHWLFSMEQINTGGTYSARLAFERPPDFQAPTGQLTVTFTRPASIDDGCTADQPDDDQAATDFLAQNGVQTLTTGGTSFGGPSNFNPTGYNESNQAGPARNEQLRSSSFGTFVRELFETPTSIAGTQSTTRADFIYWLFLALVIVALVNEIYFYTKRRRLWGIVYDARSKQPVELAVIRLFDQEHHKLLETRVTSQSGRYSFLAEPGEYYLEITKEGYHFPTRIITQSIDNEYTNLYHGEIIHLRTGQSLIAPDIPIDTESGAIQTASFFRRVIFPVLDKIRLPMILVALILAGLVQLFVQLDMIEPSPLQSFLGMIAVILLLLEVFIVRRGRK